MCAICISLCVFLYNNFVNTSFTVQIAVASFLKIKYSLSVANKFTRILIAPLDILSLWDPEKRVCFGKQVKG